MAKVDTFELAIIYWFYKEPDITKNHLELIHKNNPNCKIYGIFGGELSDSEAYEKLLGPLLDDFWAYPGTFGTDAHTKWIHGDLMLLDWYDKRGRNLNWDSVAVIQWDMLLFDDIKHVVPGIKKDQVFFSGYRELDEAVENRWTWTKPDGKHRKDYEAFKKFVSEEYDYNERLKCCLYIFEVLTSNFFEAYLKMENKKLGMLEYKDPTLAHIWGLSIYQHDVGVYWKDTRQSVDSSPLNAMSGGAIAESYIKKELEKPDGWRLFHPFEETWHE